MKDVHLLHEGQYKSLDPVGRMRYAIFIDLGIFLPTQWSFLDPAVGQEETAQGHRDITIV